METIINSKHKLFCIKPDGELDFLEVAIDDISDDGNITFRGFVPDTQVLLSQGVHVVLEDGHGVALIKAEILKVKSKGIYYCSALTQEDSSALEMVINALCNIEFCSFFEPILYKAA